MAVNEREPLAVAGGIEQVVGADKAPLRAEDGEDAVEIPEIVSQLDDGDEVEAGHDPRQDGDAGIVPRHPAQDADVPRRQAEVVGLRARDPRAGDAGLEELVGALLGLGGQGPTSAARLVASAALSSTRVIGPRR